MNGHITKNKAIYLDSNKNGIKDFIENHCSLMLNCLFKIYLFRNFKACTEFDYLSRFMYKNWKTTLIFEIFKTSINDGYTKISL